MKKETLKSYMEKSAMSGLTDSDRKMENRMVGMGRAHKKILGRKPNPNDVKQFVEEMDKKGRSIVTSENREEFMAKKLKLAKEAEPVYEEEIEEEEESRHPIAPVPARKYLKGTPEHKEAKAKQKPINGMPTNRRK